MSGRRIGTLAEYHQHREAQELRLEAHAGTRNRHAGDAQGFYAEPGSAGRGERPVTWKEWIRQTTMPEPERADVERQLITLMQDADARVRETAEAARLAEEIRDMELADAHAFGLSYRQIAHLTGTSHTVVGKCITRHHERAAKRARETGETA